MALLTKCADRGDNAPYTKQHGHHDGRGDKSIFLLQSFLDKTAEHALLHHHIDDVAKYADGKEQQPSLTAGIPGHGIAGALEP